MPQILLICNRDKTKIMHFRTKRRAQSKFDFKFNGNSLEYCKEYKYLGLWIKYLGLWIKCLGLWIKYLGLWIKYLGLWIKYLGLWI